MTISHAQYAEMLARTARSSIRQSPESAAPVEAELPLHNDIVKWCNDQWPRWNYRHTNPARKSTDTLGCEDFTVFAPGGRTFHIECKTRTGKRTEGQQIWDLELQRLGHTVHIVRSMDEFLEVVKL